MTQRVWFITGITGFVGSETLRRILKRTDARVIGLVRAASEDSLQSRYDKLLTGAFGGDAPQYAERVEFIRGELTEEHFGMDDATWERVSSTATHILHCAASVRFDLPLDEARRLNVGGTVKAIELGLAAAASGQLERFCYVGTCYVAGDRTDVVMAEELNVGQGFRNSYEQSKCESEQLVRDHMDRLPVVIFRPSIIVGDSRTGKTPAFNVIYWPVRIYAQGWWKEKFIGNMNAPADVVPINFVCDALLYILERADCIGHCYPLAAGTERCATNEVVIRLASKFFDQPMPDIIDPVDFTPEVQMAMYERLTPAQRSLVAQGKNYVPYFSQSPLFDNGPTMAALEGSGIEPPEVEEYFTNLFDYCKRTNWGRRPQG